MAIFFKKGKKYLSAGKVASLVPRLKLLMFLVLVDLVYKEFKATENWFACPERGMKSCRYPGQQSIYKGECSRNRAFLHLHVPTGTPPSLSGRFGCHCPVLTLEIKGSQASGAFSFNYQNKSYRRQWFTVIPRHCSHHTASLQSWTGLYVQMRRFCIKIFK